MVSRFGNRPLKHDVARANALLPSGKPLRKAIIALNVLYRAT